MKRTSHPLPAVTRLTDHAVFDPVPDERGDIVFLLWGLAATVGVALAALGMLWVDANPPAHAEASATTPAMQVSTASSSVNQHNESLILQFEQRLQELEHRQNLMQESVGRLSSRRDGTTVEIISAVPSTSPRLPVAAPPAKPMQLAPGR